MLWRLNLLGMLVALYTVCPSKSCSFCGIFSFT